MNPFLAAIASAALLAAPALAGGPVVLPDDPAPAAPAPVAVHDWSGPYAGLSYGTTGGEIQFLPGSFDELSSGSIAGAHIGYLWQRGSFVYGGELAFGTVRDTNFTVYEGIDRALDLKARLGFAADRVLFYGVLGYSRADLYVDGGEWKMTGISYGIGAEYAVTDRISLGLEYLSRDLEGEESGGFPVDAEGKFDTISLRLNLAF